MAIRKKMVVGAGNADMPELASGKVLENGKEGEKSDACRNCGACGCRKYATGLKQNAGERNSYN